MGTILMPGGGGGIDLDLVTALAGDVLSGKVIVGADGEPLTGTLALTGNAGTGDVLSGKTFYNNDAKTKRSGTMANRGALNWSGINTTKSVDAGYYSDGTLDSRPSYNSGRTQGQNDVKNSPNSYGLYTKAQYDANYNNGANAKVNNLSVKQEQFNNKATDSSKKAYFNVAANTGKHYVVVSVVSRANTTADTLKHSLAVTNGSISQLQQILSNSSTCVTVWHLEKTNSSAVSTITVTAGRSDADAFMLVIKLT